MPRHTITFVHELPVVPGARYYLDIDGTLLTDAAPYGQARHPDDAPFVRHLATIATVAYVTSRSSWCRTATEQMLRAAGFPVGGPLYMYDDVHDSPRTYNKGRVIQADVGAAGTAAVVVFADDMYYHLDDTAELLPHADLYLVRAAAESGPLK